MKPNTQASKK